jgi:hypothetical protein
MSEATTYLIVLIACCLIWPPMLGFVMGVTVFCLIWWGFYKMLGG